MKIPVSGKIIYDIAVSRNVLGDIPMDFEYFTILSQHIFPNTESNGTNLFYIWEDAEILQQEFTKLFGENFYIRQVKPTYANINYFADDYILHVETFEPMMTVGTFVEDRITIHTLKE